MESLECASFQLSHNDISSSDTTGNYPLSNNVGSIDNIRTNATWFNINMKNILGEMYYKYDKFNLRLSGLGLSPSSNVGSSADDRALYVKMEGLPWVNNTYDSASGVNKTACTITNIYFSASTAAQSMIFDQANIATFARCENVNIKIYFERLDHTAINAGTAGIFPRFTYFFHLFGVEK